jgi:hypothetical protein
MGTGHTCRSLADRVWWRSLKTQGGDRQGDFGDGNGSGVYRVDFWVLEVFPGRGWTYPPAPSLKGRGAIGIIEVRGFFQVNLC